MLHGQDREELLPDRDAALPERPDAARHPLSAWAINALRKAGIRTVGELAERSADELLDLPNFGADSLKRTEAFLAQRGLALSVASHDGPLPRGNPMRATAPLRIDPGIEVGLRSAGLWEGPAPGNLAVGTRLRDLLRAPAPSDAGELDALLSALGVRGLLPRPAGMNEFLVLLAASDEARREMGAARWRLSGGTPSAAAEDDAALDAAGRLLDAVEHEISRGTLHERALLGWPPMAAVNARLTPEERTLPALLGVLVRAPGLGFSAEKAARAEEALSSYRTLDEELRTLLSGVAALDRRDRLVLLGCFSRGRRLRLRDLGEHLGVSRERVRQVKVRLARGLERAHARLPLPRLETAAGVAADLDRADRPERGSGEHRGEIPEGEVHAELEGRGVARSAEATRHALAVLAAISYARELEGAS